jgi:hypothetical protein
MKEIKVNVLSVKEIYKKEEIERIKNEYNIYVCI